jgi:citronellol/citronellal dehydrogenase
MSANVQSQAGATALITGAGSGIGRASARALAADGAAVVLTELPNLLDSAATVATEIVSDGGQALAVALDVRDHESIEQCVSETLAWRGRVDVLVNNAGGQFLAPAESVSINGFRAVTRLNLDAPWYLTTRVAARSMIPNGYGKVVSVTMTPQRGIPYMAHSSAARAAVESLTQTLAVERGQHGVRIVAVAPGIVRTEAWEGYGLDPEKTAESMLLKRLQTPEEVAGVIAFCLSPAGDYITGTTIVADGGWNLVGPFPAM